MHGGVFFLLTFDTRNMQLIDILIDSPDLPRFARDTKYELVFHVARLLCVGPCSTPRAIQLLCVWMMRIPFDDTQRRELTERIRVMNQPVHVSERLHCVLIEALLVQIGLNSVREYRAVLSIPLLLVYKRFLMDNSDDVLRLLKPAFKPATITVEEVDAHVRVSVDASQQPGEYLPPVLWPFTQAACGTQVVCDLVESCHTSDVVPVYFKDTIDWLSMFVIYDVFSATEMHWGHCAPEIVPGHTPAQVCAGKESTCRPVKCVLHAENCTRCNSIDTAVIHSF